MPLDVRLDERAQRRGGHGVVAHVLEPRPGESPADPLALQVFGHFGVGKDEAVADLHVFQNGRLSGHFYLEAVALGVVFNVQT